MPRLDLSTVVVEGTDSSDLARGPGHYPSTSMPGSGGVVAIAGHRTTYGHPFRHIDDLRPGDEIDVRMPYGDVPLRRVRPANRRRPQLVDSPPAAVRELVLTACHPLYSASQRYAVFARLQADLGAAAAVGDDGTERLQRRVRRVTRQSVSLFA